MFKNLRNKIWSKIDPEDNLSERQKIGLNIFKTELNDDNCIRILNADSDKKYIISKEYFINGNAELFITLITDIDGKSVCNIINHNYLYDINFPEKTTNIINNLFKEAVKRDRAKMESVINKNVTNSLTQILKDCQEKILSKAKMLSAEEIISNEKIKKSKKY